MRVRTGGHTRRRHSQGSRRSGCPPGRIEHIDDVPIQVRKVRQPTALFHLVATRFNNLTLNAATNRVTAQGAVLNVRGAEYRLLEFFMSHPGRTFSRTQLLAQVWASDAEIDERTVDVNVQRLRKILAKPGYEACIQTVRGFGYRFTER